MATYCIGDVHGCFDELTTLLQLINYQAGKDNLWFLGDLVNRGPKSLETLRLVSSLQKVIVVLGNHDLHLLSLYHKAVNLRAKKLEPILKAPDVHQLIAWLRLQPFLHYSKKYHCVISHAGIYPGWSLSLAKSLATQLSTAINQKNCREILKNLYGNYPSKWSSNLTEFEKQRFISNVFTRMRFCDSNGNLEFANTGASSAAPLGYLPWFEMIKENADYPEIIFGHWVALNGNTGTTRATVLDTGCSWGGYLTALRLEDRKRFQVNSTIKN